MNDNQIEDLKTIMENDSFTIGVYSFYDNKSKRFDTPFHCKTDLFAGRHYKMVSDQPETMINKFKDEFDVYRLGYFNLENGTFIEEKELIIQGKFQKGENK